MEESKWRVSVVYCDKNQRLGVSELTCVLNVCIAATPIVAGESRRQIVFPPSTCRCFLVTSRMTSTVITTNTIYMTVKNNLFVLLDTLDDIIFITINVIITILRPSWFQRFRTLSYASTCTFFGHFYTQLVDSPTNAANMLGNLTPYRSMSVNKGFYISKERA